MRPGHKDYLPTLDGWRAIAILAVLIAHGTDTVFSPGGLHANDRLISFLKHGVGVEIFFAISGFLICTRLLQERQRQGRVRLSAFYIRRAFRILPPYLLYLLTIGALVAAGWIAVNSADWLSCFLFFRNYLTPWQSGSWYTAHFWSLAVEEHFYLLWPLLLVLCGRRLTPGLVMVLILSISGWRAFAFRHHAVEQLLPGVLFHVRTDIRLDGLLGGCCAALLCEIPRRREQITLLLAPGVQVVLGGITAACIVYHPRLYMLCFSLLIPLMLLSTVLRPKGLTGRILECAPLRAIGRLSYSLYIWQQLFLVGNGVPRALPLGILQEWPLNFLMVFLCASASYYGIERPMLRLGHQIANFSSAARRAGRAVPFPSAISLAESAGHAACGV